MGHSMGGGIVLTLASSPEYQYLMKDIRGWILESPQIALPPSTQPGVVKVFIGRLAGRMMPHKKLVNKMAVELITRDPVVGQSFEDDALCHNTGTLEMFAGMLDRGAALDSGETTLNDDVNSLVIHHGTGDQVTSFAASKRWIEAQTKIPDKTFKPYDGWSHTLHCDLPDNRSVYQKDVGDWIIDRSRAKGEASGGQAKL